MALLNSLALRAREWEACAGENVGAAVRVVLLLAHTVGAMLTLREAKEARVTKNAAVGARVAAGVRTAGKIAKDPREEALGDWVLEPLADGAAEKV